MAMFNAGVPLLVFPYELKNEEDKNAIANRTKQRSNIENPETLKKLIALKELRKLQLSEQTIHPSFIAGYNKHTKEFCIKILKHQDGTWFTEKEMQQIVAEVWEIKIPGVN